MLNDSSRLKYNNFDFLRLLFATTVCLVHTYELSGFSELQGIAGYLSSAVAVKAFFVVSGFLVFMSYERSQSIGDYAVKRLRRIYPAYFVTIIFFAVGLFVLSTKNFGQYFSWGFIKYLLANFSFLNFIQLSLPGVFESHKISAVNGALWTLKIEVMFYAAVPVLVYCMRKAGYLVVLMSVYGLSLFYSWGMAALAAKSGSAGYVVLQHQLPAQLCYFMAGAFFYYYLPLFERRAVYFFVPSMLILTINVKYPLPLLEPFALAAVVVFFGLFFYAGNFGKYGDFSYGVYILHFPIIQILRVRTTKFLV